MVTQRSSALRIALFLSISALLVTSSLAACGGSEDNGAGPTVSSSSPGSGAGATGAHLAQHHVDERDGAADGDHAVVRAVDRARRVRT